MVGAGASHLARRAGLCVLVALAPAVCPAQDLAPRAYFPTPVASNAIVLTYALAHGEVLFDPALPVTDVRATIHSPVVSLYHAFDLAGRSANVTGSLPFAVGNLSGKLVGEDRAIRRVGVSDAFLRLAVNLHGGPARTAAEFAAAPPPRTLVGASVKVVLPTGHYDPSRAINVGTNRWAVKPEVAGLKRIGGVILEGYAGVWFFTANDEAFGGPAGAPLAVRTQAPIAAGEIHLSYDINRRCWISADINYWRGGRTSVNGVKSAETLQSNSRFGVTGSLPLWRRQSLKISYSDGLIVRVGGKFRVLSAGWQYGWLGRRFR